MASRIPSPVLVTGASSGIGRATVDRLVADGVGVIATVRKEADEQALIAAHGDRVTVLRFDLTDHEALTLAVKEIDALGALVNNAGAAYTAPLEFVDLDDLRHHLEVNLIGQIALTQAVLPLLRAHGPGARIINIGSIAGRVSTPMAGPYHMGKHALAAFSASLRAELRGDGIAVTLIEPGAIDTAIWDSGGQSARRMRSALPEVAQQRYAALLDLGEKVTRNAHRIAIPADVVARVITQQLAAPRPAPRKLVGLDARLLGLLDLLPDRVRFALVERTAP